MSAVFSPDRTWRYTLTRELWERESLVDGPDGLLVVEVCPSCNDPYFMCSSPEVCLGEREPRTVLFVCLNPSKADETKDDQTVRKLMRYARRWGFERLVVCNIFAARSTDPKALYSHREPIGPDNSKHIRAEAEKADMVVAAWGSHGDFANRGDFVRDVLYEAARDKVHVLALTKKTGQPGHPLYLRADLKPRRLWP